MNNEAPERLWISPKQAWLYAKPEELRDPFDTQQYRRVDPPAAPTADKVDAERQAAAIVTIWRAIKDHHDKLLVHYIKQTLLEFHNPTPAAPDERDKALAKRIVGSEGRAVYDFYALMDRIATTLATVRAEVWRDAILMVDTAPLCHCAGKEYVDPVALVQRMNAALESARGKVEKDDQKSTPTGLSGSPR